MPVEHPSRDSASLLEQAACQPRAGGRRSGARVSAPGPERRGRTRRPQGCRRRHVLPPAVRRPRAVTGCLVRGHPVRDSRDSGLGVPNTLGALGAARLDQTPHTPAGLMPGAAERLPQHCTTTATPAQSTTATPAQSTPRKLARLIRSWPCLGKDQFAHSNGFSGSPRDLGCGVQLAP